MYTVIIDGIEIKCDTPSEAIGLARQAAARPSPAPVSRRADAMADLTVPAGKAGQLLMEVKRANGPVSAATLVSSLALPNGQGLGPVFSGLKTALGKFDISPEDVIRKTRSADGSSVWEAGPRLEEALRTVYKRTG